MAALIVKSGPLAGQRFEVAREVVVGRQGADLTLPDEQTSRHHASLRPVPGGLEVTDLGSLNGTWVDGARISAPVTLGHDATLVLGETTLCVDAHPPPDPPRVATATPPSDRTRVAVPTPRPASMGPRAAPRPAPIGPFAAAPISPARRPGAPATRMLVPAAMSFATILATAVALLLYFALR